MLTLRANWQNQCMDPRAVHTRSALFAAILELAAKRPINEIPVTEITTTAGVNRSSFYQHFSDREDLLASALESLETEATRIRASPSFSPLSGPPTELISFAKHFADHAELYRQALGPHGSARVASRVRSSTAALVQEGIEVTQPSISRGMPIEIDAAGTAGALLGIIETWLSMEPLPPYEEAASWMWQTLNPNFAS